MESFFYIIVKLFGIIALIVAVTQFFRIKSDQFYKLIFDKCTWITKNKVLIIDDFDRVSVDKQEEAYKLFNILHGKLPIVFLGDFSKITRNDDQYLQKIIDRQVEFPHVLQSECIWEGYFSKVQDSLGDEIKSELKALFVEERRNIREQVHFNDYVNLVFFDRKKLDMFKLINSCWLFICICSIKTTTSW